MNTATSAIKRGDVFMAELPATVGVEQDKMRPVVIVSNNTANDFGDLVTVIPITTQAKKILPTHVTIQAVGKTMIVLCEQIRSIDKSRLENYKFTIDAGYMAEIEKSMKVQLGVKDSPTAQESLDIRMKKAEFICMLADDMCYPDKRVLYDCAVELIYGARVLDRNEAESEQWRWETPEVEAEPANGKAEPDKATTATPPESFQATPPEEKPEQTCNQTCNQETATCNNSNTPRNTGRYNSKPENGYYLSDVARLLEQTSNKIWYIVKKLNLKNEKYGYLDAVNNRFIFNEAAVTEIMNYLNKQ